MTRDYSRQCIQALRVYLQRCRKLLEHMASSDYDAAWKLRLECRAAFHNFVAADALRSPDPDVEDQLRDAWTEIESIYSQIQHLEGGCRSQLNLALDGNRKERSRIQRFRSANVVSSSIECKV